MIADRVRLGDTIVFFAPYHEPPHHLGGASRVTRRRVESRVTDIDKLDDGRIRFKTADKVWAFRFPKERIEVKR